MNMLYLLAAAFALIGVLLIAGFVKHVRESAATTRRFERESFERAEARNREFIDRLHRESQADHRPRAYPIAARGAPPRTAQQNSVPAQSADLNPLLLNPVPDFSVPLSHAHSAPAEACNARSFAPNSSPSYRCDSIADYDSSSGGSSCDPGSSSCDGGGGSGE